MAGKPVLLELMSLSTYKGNLNIVRSSAKNYREIGSILLNDRHGHRVDIISHDKRGHAEAVMLEVYKKWLDEEEGGNCSWVTLTDCFRQCGLHHLASCTEQHFEFPLHHHYTKGIIIASHYCHTDHLCVSQHHFLPQWSWLEILLIVKVSHSVL